MSLSDHGHHPKQSYYRRNLTALYKFLIPKESSVLEIGCGQGDILAALPISRGCGVDSRPDLLKQAQADYPNLNLVFNSDLRLSDESKFEYLILTDVVGRLVDIQGFLTDLGRHCQSGSRLVITYYNNLWEPILKLAKWLKIRLPSPAQNWLNYEDIDGFLNLAGFEVVKKGECVLFPKYIPFLSSFFNRFCARLPLLRRLCLVNYVVARPLPHLFPAVNIPKVSVIIPARNEEGNIEAAVKRLPVLGSHTEIIFVEGNSTDNTWNKIKDVQANHPDLDIKIMQQSGVGKGDAVRKGFDAAEGEILIILDADLTVRPEELPKFCQALITGAGEFINGSRLVYQLEDKSMRLLNIVGNKFFSMAFSWLLSQRLKDTLCGTKVLWRHDYEKIKQGRSFFGDFDPFGDFDLLFGAAKLNLKIIDLPIRYQARVYGSTNISRFKHGWLLLRMCFFALRKIKFI